MSRYRAIVWNESITLYHRSESKGKDGKTVTTWTKTSLSNCFYGRKLRQQLSADMEIVSNNLHVARIPVTSISSGFAIGKGDIIVKGGAVSDTLASNDSGKALLDKYFGSCFMVNVVTDNTKLQHSAHWYASED
jgi:hypothetical protein